MVMSAIRLGCGGVCRSSCGPSLRISDATYSDDMSPLGRLITLCVVISALTVPDTASASSPRDRDPGPTLRISAAKLDKATRCSANVAKAPKAPVLLIHGSGLSAEETWGRSYVPALAQRGHGFCVVDLPNYGMTNEYNNLEYVVAAVRKANRLSRRKIAIVGASKGASEAIAVLRLWPDLPSKVDDVIGIAGVYDNGSTELSRRCDPECPPPLRQLAFGSSYLEALGRWALPQGVSYSLIGTNQDTTVTPQPQANFLPVGTSIQIEEVCPDRAAQHPTSHGLLITDAVAYALMVDALDHPGATSASHIDAGVCDKRHYEGFDYDDFVAGIPSDRSFRDTRVEPPTRCYLRHDCQSATDRGRILRKHRVTTRPNKIVYRAFVERAGEIRLRFNSRTVTRGVTRGRVTLRIPRDARRSTRARFKQLKVQTRTSSYPRWALERAARIRI